MSLVFPILSLSITSTKSSFEYRTLFHTSVGVVKRAAFVQSTGARAASVSRFTSDECTWPPALIGKYLEFLSAFVNRRLFAKRANSSSYLARGKKCDGLVWEMLGTILSTNITCLILMNTLVCVLEKCHKIMDCSDMFIIFYICFHKI